MKIPDGPIAIAAIACCVSMFIVAIVGLSQLPKGLRDYRIPFRWSVTRVIERSYNPVGFWFVFIMYSLVSLASLAFAIWIGIGLLQKWK
jgi:hypothetical protein